MRKREAPGLSGTDRDRNMIKNMWPSLTFSEKLSYIFSYYGTAIIIVLIGVAAMIYMIHNIMTPKPENMLYVMCVDCDADEDDAAVLQDELMDYLSLDPDTQEVLVETSYKLSSNYQSQATISTYMQAGRVDVVIAPEETFNTYAATQYLATLDEAGLSEIRENTDTDHLFYAVPVDYSQGGAITDIPYAPHDDSEGAGCYGIYITEGIFDGYVIGIMANSPHPDNARDTVLYLLGDTGSSN